MRAAGQAQGPWRLSTRSLYDKLAFVKHEGREAQGHLQHRADRRVNGANL